MRVRSIRALLYEQEKLEKYLTCKLLREKQAKFFWGKIGSCTS